MLFLLFSLSKTQCCPARRKTHCLSRIYTAKKKRIMRKSEHCHAMKKERKKSKQTKLTTEQTKKTAWMKTEQKKNK